MKKVIIAIISIIVLTITGLSIYVSTIDWNKHKGALSEQIMEITGKKVVFSGPVSMSIFPTPSLKASNVRVYSATHQDLNHPLMKIKSLVARLSFSALLGGSFDVKMMSLEKPEILVHRSNSEVNWIDGAKTNVDAELKDINIALDSVMLNDATMVIEDEDHHINTMLKNLNAEIIAEGLRGPYRVDGSYTKDGYPQGFAISIGNISESFATNLNFVLSQPASETYLRFDGTFLLNNDAVNGNLLIESQKFKTFYDTVIPTNPLPDYWDNRLEASMEFKLSKTQMDFANIILKFGSSAGAGNISIPLKSKSYIIGEDDAADTREVNVKFDMTELDVSPILLSIRDFVSEQMKENALYSPDIPFDMNFDMTVLKAEYNQQISKNLEAKLKLHDNVWEIVDFSGELPGDTFIKAVGKVLSVEDVLTYALTVDAKTNSLKKLLEWGGQSVQAVANSTYQKSSLSATISGNTNVIKISPLSFAIDNTLLTGQFGVKRGNPSHYALDLSTENIILDNYLPKVFEGKDLMSVITDFWKNSQWANTIDFDVNFRAGLVIYEKTSFENVVLKSALQKGILNIVTFSIGDVLKSNLQFSGEISGFADKLQLSNLNYKIAINEYDPWLKRFNFEQPKWGYSYFAPLSAEGVMSLNQERFWLRTHTKAGKTKIDYTGRLDTNTYNLDGDVNFVASDTNEFLRNLPLDYALSETKLGRLGLKGKIVGNMNKFKLSDMLLNIGSNTFQGILGADLTRSDPYVIADLIINRFEPERFMPQTSEPIQFTAEKSEDNVSGKPVLSDKALNWSNLKKFVFSGKLAFGELFLHNHLLKNAKMTIDNKDGILSLSDVESDFNDGHLSSSLKLNYIDHPQASGQLHVTNQNIYDLNLAVGKYGLKSGIAEFDTKFDTSILSWKDLLDHFTGTVSFNINEPIVEGMDISAIAEDLAKRHVAAGLNEVLLENLKQSETPFEKISGHLTFKNGNLLVERMLLSSELANIDVSGTGNLEAWNMDLLFHVQLDEPQDIEPFMFSLKGSVQDPTLEVDASPITKVYADQIAKEEAEKKAKEMARLQELKNRVKEQSDVLQNVKITFDDYWQNEFIPIKNKIVSEQQKMLVDKLEERLKYHEHILSEADALLAKKEVKDDYPERLAKVNELIQNELPEIREHLWDFYLQDLKMTIKQNYNAIVEENKAKEDLIKQSLAQHDIHVLRLSGIRVGYDFDTDKVYHEMLDTINDQMSIYDAIVKNVNKYGDGIADLNDVELAEQYAADSATMLEKAKKQREVLSEDIRKYLVYVDEKLKKEEKAIADKKEEAEKLEQESKAKINVDGKGSIIVPSQAEAVPTMVLGVEQATQGETIVPSVDSLGEVNADKLEVNLLRPKADEPTATGTIIKR